MPIFTATQSLDVNYKFEYESKERAVVKVPGVGIHAILHTAVDQLLLTRNSLQTKTQRPVYSDALKDRNFATAAVTLLYTDTTPEEGYLSEQIEQKTFAFTVNDQKERILACLDLYDSNHVYKQSGISNEKSKRSTYFNSLLSQRIHSFSEITDYYDLPSTTISDISKLQSSINGEMFHETFHHTEQAIMHTLSGYAGLQSLVVAARQCGASYIYGLVLDLFTQRMLCCNCNGSLLGLQNSCRNGFLFDLSNALIKERIIPRIGRNPMLSVRASAIRGSKGIGMDALRLVDDNSVVHEYNSNQNLPVVFQASATTLGTKKIADEHGFSLSSYSGAFLVSKSFPKKILEDHLQLRSISL